MLFVLAAFLHIISGVMKSIITVPDSGVVRHILSTKLSNNEDMCIFQGRGGRAEGRKKINYRHEIFIKDRSGKATPDHED